MNKLPQTHHTNPPPKTYRALKNYAQSLNQLAEDIHTDNKVKGFYDEPREVGTTLMLIVSELAEALEGDRKQLMDDHIPHRSMLEVELGDAIIRILDMAAWLQLDVGNAIMEKLAYNRGRPYKHGKKY